jgi:gas vesicle protein
MVFKGLLDSINKEKKRKQTIQSVQQIAVGAGIVALAAAAGVATGVLIAPKSGKETRDDMKDKVLSFNDTVQRKTDSFKKSAVESAQAVGNAIKDIHGKAIDVKKDIKDGLEDVSNDVRNTSGHIVNEFNNL